MKVYRNILKSLVPYLLLIVLCACLFLPGQSTIPVTDRDEARFAQASKQMLLSGDTINIYFQENRRDKKPVGIYWLQTQAVRLTGSLQDDNSPAIWPYRLPSLVAATLAVLAFYYFGAGLVGSGAGFIGAVMLASSPLVIGEAHLATTDAVLLLLTVLALGPLGRIFASDNQTKKAPVVACATIWLAVGLGVLIKGPALPTILLLTVLGMIASDRSLRWVSRLRPLWGIPLAALPVIPWLLAIDAEAGVSFAQRSFVNDILPKIIGAHESHGGYPGYYLLLSLIFLFPWIIFVPRGLFILREHKTNRSISFLACWLLPSWLFFELMPTKLPHYVLPLYPPLCLLLGIAVWLCLASRTLESLTLERLLVYLWALIALAIATAAVLVESRFNGSNSLASLIFASGASFSAIWMIIRTGGRRFTPGAALATCALFLAFMPLLYGVILPQISAPWVSSNLAKTLHDLGLRTPPIISGYSEPSAVFLLGTKTRFLPGVEAARVFQTECNTPVIVESRELSNFLGALSAKPQSLATVSGFNYNKGRAVELSIFKCQKSQVE